MELVYPNEVFSEKYNVVLLTIVEGVKLLPTRQKSSTQCLQRFNKIYYIILFLSIEIIIKRYIHTKICMILKTPLLFQVFFQPLSDCPPTEAAATSQVQS